MEQAREAGGIVSALAAELGVAIAPVIDCSTMLRAWRTARLLSEGLDGAFHVECFDALAERGVGAAANLSVDEIVTLVEQDPRFDPLPAGWKSDSHFRLPFQGAESLIEAGDRVAAHLVGGWEASR